MPKPSNNIHNILYAFILICFQASSTTKAQSSLWTYCDADKRNYTQGSPYQANLNLTLTSLVSNTSTSNGFNTTIIGTNPDTVYGLLQCRGDISSQDCRICANTAKSEIIKQCPNQREAAIFYDKCMLHYAGYSFFNTLQNFVIFRSPSPQNTTNPRLFSGQLFSLMNNLTSKAASDGSKFSTGSTPFNGSVNIYGLAQCTQDLSQSICLGCLQNMIGISSSCCSRSIGAVLLSPNCGIRYEPYLFFEESKVDPTRTNPTSGNPQGKKRNTRNIVLIVISIIVASAICIYILWSKITKRRVGYSF